VSMRSCSWGAESPAGQGGATARGVIFRPNGNTELVRLAALLKRQHACLQHAAFCVPELRLLEGRVTSSLMVVAPSSAVSMFESPVPIVARLGWLVRPGCQTGAGCACALSPGVQQLEAGALPDSNRFVLLQLKLTLYPL